MRCWQISYVDYVEESSSLEQCSGASVLWKAFKLWLCLLWECLPESGEFRPCLTDVITCPFWLVL